MTGRELIREYYNEIQQFIDCIRVGIYISDNEGNTLMMNRESEKTGGMSKEELVGKNMKELIEMGYVTDSSILKVLKSGKEEQIIQLLGEGGQLFISGVPLMQDEKIDLVICTERDITETINLKELLKVSEGKAEQYGTELEYQRKHNLEEQGELVYASFGMRSIIDKALRVARMDTTVLLTGESGTGKELVANLIQENSARIEKPYIKINCAAVPGNLLESEFFGYEKGSFSGADKEGKAGIFELVSGGTIFLDEIGDLPVELQSKLLRAIQEREIRRIGGKESIPIDVRIIAATNMNLQKAVEEGKFREDLFYRLNVMPIDIPPLRERKEDVEKLAVHFTEKFNKKFKVSKIIASDAITVFKNYDWPGNVRELRNVLERIFVSYDGNVINRFQAQSQLLTSKPEEPHERTIYKGSLYEILEAYERELLVRMLSKHKPAKVAQLLNVNKSTVSRKMKKYGLQMNKKIAE